MSSDNPDWTDADFLGARPFPEMFPELARYLKVQGGRPRLARPKVHVGFRLAADVVEGSKARQGLQCPRRARAAERPDTGKAVTGMPARASNR